jgi:hypothetical protein
MHLVESAVMRNSIKSLSLLEGAGIKASDCGPKVIRIAMVHGHFEIMVHLIENGCQIDRNESRLARVARVERFSKSSVAAQVPRVLTPREMCLIITEMRDHHDDRVLDWLVKCDFKEKLGEATQYNRDAYCYQITNEVLRYHDDSCDVPASLLWWVNILGFEGVLTYWFKNRPLDIRFESSIWTFNLRTLCKIGGYNTTLTWLCQHEVLPKANSLQDQALIRYASRTGQVPFLEWYFDHQRLDLSCHCDNERVVREAAENDHVDVLCLLENKGIDDHLPSFLSIALRAGIMNDRKEAVEFALIRSESWWEANEMSVSDSNMDMHAWVMILAHECKFDNPESLALEARTIHEANHCIRTLRGSSQYRIEEMSQYLEALCCGRKRQKRDV